MNDSHLLCIDLYILESQGWARGWAGISIPNTCPQQGQLYPQTRILGTVSTQVWQMLKGSHCPQHEKAFPYAQPGPLISPQVPRPLASPGAAKWRPWLPLLNHLLKGGNSFPRLKQPCFSTSLHGKNVFSQRFRGPHWACSSLSMSFPQRSQVKAAPTHGLTSAELKYHVI